MTHNSFAIWPKSMSVDLKAECLPSHCGENQRGLELRGLADWKGQNKEEMILIHFGRDGRCGAVWLDACRNLCRTH